MKQHQHLRTVNGVVIARGKRAKALIKVKLVKNINQNPLSFKGHVMCKSKGLLQKELKPS